MDCSISLIEHKYEGSGNDWNLANINEMTDYNDVFFEMKSYTSDSKVPKSSLSNNRKCMLWRVTNVMGSKVRLPCVRSYDRATGFHGDHWL